MKIIENISLSKYTTVHIGGTARKMYVPETREELIKAINDSHCKYFIGGGSNLLINDRVFDAVINLRYFDRNIVDHGNGKYYVGGSVRLQELIRKINADGYGGIEYLYSVPGLLGGAVVMNAGGSKEQGWSISDHIISVTALHDGQIYSLNRDQCDFLHRHSIFKNDTSYIVLGAEMQFDKGESKDFERACKERINFCKIFQDNSKPNFGSVFRLYNGYIMEIVRILSNRKKTVHFSHKTANWLINEGNGTFSQADKLLKKVIMIHKILGKKCATEVIIWR